MGSLTQFIIAFGYIGVFITIFAESGFLLGFFLPGDSLIFTVGLLSARGIFNIYLLVILCVIAAIAGDSLGYYLGYMFGPRLFDRDDSRFFKKEYVERTEKFFKEHGVRTIILARFTPIIRTFAPVMAGVGQMKYRIFLAYNIIGGALWAGGLLLISYYLGNRFPGIEHYLTYIIILILIVSVIPIALDLLKKR